MRTRSGMAIGFIVCSIVLCAGKSMAASCALGEHSIKEPSIPGVSAAHYTFSEDTVVRGDRSYAVVNGTEQLDIDMGHLRSQFAEKFNAQVPGSRCSKRYTPHSHRVGARRDGSLIASARVKYEYWSCNKLFGKKIRFRIFRKTVTVYMKFVASVDSDNNSWSVGIAKSWVDDNNNVFEDIFHGLLQLQSEILEFVTIGLVEIPTLQDKLDEIRGRLPRGHQVTTEFDEGRGLLP